MQHCTPLLNTQDDFMSWPIKQFLWPSGGITMGYGKKQCIYLFRPFPSASPASIIHVVRVDCKKQSQVNNSTWVFYLFSNNNVQKNQQMKKILHCFQFSCTLLWETEQNPVVSLGTVVSLGIVLPFHLREGYNETLHTCIVKIWICPKVTFTPLRFLN